MFDRHFKLYAPPDTTSGTPAPAATTGTSPAPATPATETPAPEPSVDELKRIAARAKQVDSENMALKADIKRIKDAEAAAEQKRLEDAAKVSGDYSKLQASVEEKAKKLKSTLVKLTKENLGRELGVSKVEYMDLFTFDFTVSDSMDVENYVDAKTAAAKFKADNPELFKGSTAPTTPQARPVKLPVPKTDNGKTASEMDARPDRTQRLLDHIKSQLK